jgi:hypothetical protein
MLELGSGNRAISNGQVSTVVGTYCREGPTSEVVGLVNGILAIVDMGGRVGIDLV